jgi:hypothetical protein
MRPYDVKPGIKFRKSIWPSVIVLIVLVPIIWSIAGHMIWALLDFTCWTSLVLECNLDLEWF